MQRLAGQPPIPSPFPQDAGEGDVRLPLALEWGRGQEGSGWAAPPPPSLHYGVARAAYTTTAKMTKPIANNTTSLVKGVMTSNNATPPNAALTA